MANSRKSLIPFEVYNSISFPVGYGSPNGKVKILSKSAAGWDNGVITFTEKTAPIKPTIYSSLTEGTTTSQPLDSSEYVPLATITVTNKQEPNGTLYLYNPGQIPLVPTINLSIKGASQTINFAPLTIQRLYIGFHDFAEYLENDKNKDTVVFPKANGYQNLQIINPQTKKPENSAFHFGYVGAVEGGPRAITKDELLVPGGKSGSSAELNDGQTKTFTLYGRLFAVDIFDPIKIISISEDTGIKGDFRTSDNTLIFNGTAEPKSKVEVFINNKSIGIAYANAQGNWLHNYSQFTLPDGKHILTAAETNLFGEVKTTIPQQLEIDTDYDIDLDFSDTSVANNKPLQDQIIKAAHYWEEIITKDIPDVNGIGGFIDDLKIKFIVEELKDKKGVKDGKEGQLAVTNGYSVRGNLPTNSIDPLTGQPLSSFNYLPSYAVITIDSADISDIINTKYGLQTLEHEIAHAIGFNYGTFNGKGLVETIKTPDKTTVLGYGFKGQNALKAYHALGGKATHASVPLEDKPDPRHWNEWLFPDGQGETFSILNLPVSGQDELMTTSTPEPPYWKEAILSKLTLGAFEDLGFKVDDAEAGDIRVFQGKDSNTILGFVSNPLFGIPY